MPGASACLRRCTSLGVRTWPSAANFVLMDIGPRHKQLCAAMRDKGVLLRDRSSDPGCEGYVRITIGPEEHVTRGIEALRASLAEIGWTPAEGMHARRTGTSRGSSSEAASVRAT